jgi:hypothetical protein
MSYHNSYPHGEANADNNTAVFGPKYADNYSEAYLAEFNAIYDTSIAPYEDDELLSGRLDTRNRSMRRHPELAGMIAEAIAAADDQSILDTVDAITLARRDDKPIAEKPIGTIISYLTLETAIYAINEPTSGPESSDDRMNAIGKLAGSSLVEDVSDVQVGEYAVCTTYLRYRSAALAEKHIGSPALQTGYLVNALTALEVRLNNRYRAI